MAEEYVNKESLAKHIDSRFGEISTPFVVREIRAFPNADVAPRAEAEKWFRECEELQGRMIELEREVAREIFEEIEKIIDKHHSECYEYEDGDECDTAITYISYISCDLDELKKKYTEEEE